MSGLRRVLFWVHLFVGLGIAVVVLFLAVTGSVMAFAPQMVRWAERGVHAGAAGGDGCVAPGVLVGNAAAAATGLGVAGRPAGLLLYRGTRPAEVSFGNDGTVVLLDGCSGRVLGTGARGLRVFVKSVTELHHNMAWAGRRHEGLNTVKNAAVLGFVFLVLSGLVLWLPRAWTAAAVRMRTVPRWTGLRERAREWNLHHVAGLWFALPLLVISGTGTVMAWPWANALLFRAAGEQPPVRRAEAPAGPRRQGGGERPQAGPGMGGFARLDVPVKTAMAVVPAWSSVSVRLSGGRPGGDTDGGGPVQVAVSRGEGGQAVLRDQLLIARDGTVVKAEPYSGLSRGRRWRLWVRFGHTGELLGWPGQTVAFLSTLAALLLAWTGVSLSLRRWAGWRARRAVRV